MHVGITGHQRLQDEATWSWVASAIRGQLSRAGAPLVGVTSLAVGADQLFARLVLEQGGTLFAVLPFADIERTFSREDLPAYRDLRSRAAVEILDTRETDGHSFLAAGMRVVDLSEVLLAVWDGEPARGKGGTADVVAYALARGKRLVHIDPVARTVR